jgi:hypothetical protein
MEWWIGGVDFEAEAEAEAEEEAGVRKREGVPATERPRRKGSNEGVQRPTLNLFLA